MGLPKKLNRITRDKLEAYAAWPPIGNTFELGDYGVISRGVFKRLGNIREFDIDIGEPRVAPSPLRIDFTSSGATARRVSGEAEVKTFPAQPIDARLELCFSEAESFLVKSKHVVVTELDNVRQIAEACKSAKGWQRRWRVIRQVFTARDAAVIATQSADTKVTLSGKADALRQLELGGASAGIGVTGSNQLSLTFMGNTGVIALGMFKIGYFLGGIALEAMGDDEQEPVAVEAQWGLELVDDELGWEGAASVGHLEDLLRGGERDTALRLVDAYLAELDEYNQVLSSAVAHDVLELLKQFALFDELGELASRVRVRLPGDDYMGRWHAARRHAEALIGSRNITEAIGQLLPLQQELQAGITALEQTRDFDEITRRRVAQENLSEVTGLLGRAYKHLYASASPTSYEPRSYDLDKSVSYYSDVFYRNPWEFYWHGVNFIALKTHYERVRTGDPAAIPSDARKAAELLLSTFADRERSGPLNAWQLASRAEAQLALGLNKQAIDSVRAYLDHPNTSYFQVQSTSRQFHEIWRLTADSPPGKQILPMMEAAFARLGGALNVSLDDSTAKQVRELESVYGDTKYQPLQWLAGALERARCVARLGRSLYDGNGTGFLFDGRWISKSLKDTPLLLTNAHVCTSDDRVRHSLPSYDVLQPEELVVGFFAASDEGQSTSPIRVEEELYTSPPGELDATLLTLQSIPSGLEPPKLAKAKSVHLEDRVNIIGHPKGRSMSISIRDNRVTGQDGRYLYYRTPTDPGSSGSPIFNEAWQLVGLHHSSKKARQSNEGIEIHQLIQAIKQRIA